MKLILIIGICISKIWALPLAIEYPKLSSEQLNIKISPRNAILDNKFRWKNAEVPFEIDLSFSQEENTKIKAAIDKFSQTCVNFRPRTYLDRDFLSIKKGNECDSPIGRRGGRQIVTLQSEKCFNEVGSIVHVLMHALGFYHEQAREDRDDYVEILWDNVPDNKIRKFMKYSSQLATDFGIPYDYNSIMHYPANAYSANGKDTIRPKDPTATIGQRVKLSDLDIAKINKMYESNCHLAP